MSNFIYSRTTEKGIQSFYLLSNGIEYYLFSQKFYRGVKNFFGKKVTIDRAIDNSKSHSDTALLRTMEKLPAKIKYVEKEYGLNIFKRSNKKENKFRNRRSYLCY